MAKKEWSQFLEMAKAKGYSSYDIVKMLTKMFIEGKLNRDQFIILLETIGYDLSDNLRALSDDDLKKELQKPY